ncbi:MAG: AmmeMemoRadiSam system protein A [Gammaproteobacteria bacterium]
MSSTDDRREFTAGEREILLRIAYQSIRSGLEASQPAAISNDGVPARLSARRASFVTLHADEKLRGCIGSLEPRTSLAEDVSFNAYAAAFRDTRFQPLQANEIDILSLDISVLSRPEMLDFDSESSLLGIVRPGVDGLILQEHDFRSTFLPSVWESLPDPAHFLGHLKLKAGLATDYWSASIRVWRYTTESFGTSVPAIRTNNRD